MTDPRVVSIYALILALNQTQLSELRKLLADGGGDPAGVGAVLPPHPPLDERGVELPMSEWPDEYWESQA